VKFALSSHQTGRILYEKSADGLPIAKTISLAFTDIIKTLHAALKDNILHNPVCLFSIEIKDSISQSCAKSAINKFDETRLI
jgi:hypothetical protein